MNLSYVLRLLCLVVVVIGAVHALVQLVLAACARPFLRLLAPLLARTQERILFAIQIAPFAAAILFAGLLCVPQYLRLEPTNSSEAVSSLCLALAAAVVLWFGFSAIRGLRTAFRTWRFVGNVSRSARASAAYGSLPVLALRETGPLIALVGFFRPSILVSIDLLSGKLLDFEALALALDHERSHAAQRDNWKLLSLSLLPRIGPNPWLRLWQAAAEWAADDDAARADPSRRILLAEALVRVARSNAACRLPVLHTAFSCRDEDLARRVSRLIDVPAAPRRSPRFMLLGLSAVALSVLAAAIALSPWVYALSESILHLS